MACRCFKHDFIPQGQRGPSSRGALLPFPEIAGIQLSRCGRANAPRPYGRKGVAKGRGQERISFKFFRARARLYLTARSEHPSIWAMRLIGRSMA